MIHSFSKMMRQVVYQTGVAVTSAASNYQNIDTIDSGKHIRSLSLASIFSLALYSLTVLYYTIVANCSL